MYTPRFPHGSTVGWRFHLSASSYPDVVPEASLQGWLECAWKNGFDTMGSVSLGGRVQGSTKWVGTLEVASVLRQFGIKAHFVDFVGEVLECSG